MAELRLASNLSLPLDTVTQAVAVLAKRRAGKTYLARRLVEQIHAAGQQQVIIDPKGDWWGILSSRDGKGPGLPFVIIGGERGHIPLEASGGEVVAKLIVEQRVSVLIDLSLLRKHEVATFCAAFLETLYRMKAHERYRTPLTVHCDEADALAPQKPQPNEARMLGAMEDLVRRGGQRGIGVVMISQRAAVLNKNVLTQVQILIALRTISPQDIAAMNAWIDVHGTPEQRKTLIGSLPSLPVGDAWVWSPGWPTDAGIFQRIHTLPIETFDSGATPKPGEKRVEPKRMADVDLDAVREQMAATIERAKADDPKALRKRIAELEGALTERVAVQSQSDSQRIAEIEEDCAGHRHRALRLERALDDMHADFDRVAMLLSDAQAVVGKSRADKVSTTSGLGLPDLRDPLADAPSSRPPARPVPQQRAAAAPGELRAGARRMLQVLAEFAPATMTRHQIGFAAGVKHTSGTFSTYWGEIKALGYLAESGGEYTLTPAGFRFVGTVGSPKNTYAARAAAFKADLRAGAVRMLERVMANPRGVSREQLGRETDVAHTSGTFSTYLGELVNNRLVQKSGQMLTPHPWLVKGASNG